MGIIVGRWLKKGTKKLWTTQFNTARGAKRAAEVTAKTLGSVDRTSIYTVGKPFRHGEYWNVYVHVEKVGRY